MAKGCVRVRVTIAATALSLPRLECFHRGRCLCPRGRQFPPQGIGAVLCLTPGTAQGLDVTGSQLLRKRGGEGQSHEQASYAHTRNPSLPPLTTLEY